jgi:opacity protein-like surface antigen
MRIVIKACSAGLLALLIFAGTPRPAAAQSSGPGVGVGFKVGPNFADFSSDVLDIDTRTGWHAGLFIGGNRSGVVGWQTEINWIRKQGRIADIDQDIRIDYVQVPVLLRLNIGTESRQGFAFYAIAGPGFSFKVADEINGVTIDDAFEGTDVGLVAGAGVEITRVILEGRYEWGFRHINKNFTDVDEVKTRSFTFLVGIRFN